MNVLKIAVRLDADASPHDLETMVRGVRAAVDVGRLARFRRVKRAAAEQMRYPTDEELADAATSLPGDSAGLSGRAQQHLQARRELEEAAPDLPYRLGGSNVYEYLRQVGPSTVVPRLSSLGYDRVFGAPGSWAAGQLIGLDALDPELHQALVALSVGRSAPSQIVVREIRYLGRFRVELAAVGTGVQPLSEIATAIAAVTAVSDMRTTSPLNLGVAGATELGQKEREGTETGRTSRERLDPHEDPLSTPAPNLHVLGLDPQQQQKLIVEFLTVNGNLDLAAAAESLTPLDSSALLTLCARRPQLEYSVEDGGEVDT